MVCLSFVLSNSSRRFWYSIWDCYSDVSLVDMSLFNSFICYVSWSLSFSSILIDFYLTVYLCSRSCICLSWVSILVSLSRIFLSLSFSFSNSYFYLLAPWFMSKFLSLSSLSSSVILFYSRWTVKLCFSFSILKFFSCSSNFAIWWDFSLSLLFKNASSYSSSFFSFASFSVSSILALLISSSNCYFVQFSSFFKDSISLSFYTICCSFRSSVVWSYSFWIETYLIFCYNCLISSSNSKFLFSYSSSFSVDISKSLSISYFWVIRNRNSSLSCCVLASKEEFLCLRC